MAGREEAVRQKEEKRYGRKRRSGTAERGEAVRQRWRFGKIKQKEAGKSVVLLLYKKEEVE